MSAVKIDDGVQQKSAVPYMADKSHRFSLIPLSHKEFLTSGNRPMDDECENTGWFHADSLQIQCHLHFDGDDYTIVAQGVKSPGNSCKLLRPGAVPKLQ